jgi:hypothetical protein
MILLFILVRGTYHNEQILNWNSKGFGNGIAIASTPLEIKSYLGGRS